MNWLRIRKAIADFHAEEDGPTAVEYAVLIGLIIVACMTGVQAMANKAQESFDESATAIADAIG